MCTTMDEIEQQCEDAVFEVCDARERYPALCANELARCIRLETEISLNPVKPRKQPKLETVLITDEHKMLFDSFGIESKDEAVNEKRAKKLTNLLNKMEDLKIAVEQINREKYCEIDRLLLENENYSDEFFKNETSTNK